MKVVALIPAALLATSLTGCVVAPLVPGYDARRAWSTLRQPTPSPVPATSGATTPASVGAGVTRSTGGIAVGAERA